MNEEVLQQGGAWHGGVSVEVRYASLAQHILVDEEVSCATAAAADQDRVGGVRDDLGRPAPFGRNAYMPARGRLDHGPRPERVHGDPRWRNSSAMPSTHMLMAYFDMV